MKCMPLHGGLFSPGRERACHTPLKRAFVPSSCFACGCCGEPLQHALISMLLAYGRPARVRARAAGGGRSCGRPLRGQRRAACGRMRRRAARQGGLWRRGGAAADWARRRAGRQARRKGMFVCPPVWAARAEAFQCVTGAAATRHNLACPPTMAEEQFSLKLLLSAVGCGWPTEGARALPGTTMAGPRCTGQLPAACARRPGRWWPRPRRSARLLRLAMPMALRRRQRRSCCRRYRLRLTGSMLPCAHVCIAALAAFDIDR